MDILVPNRVDCCCFCFGLCLVQGNITYDVPKSCRINRTIYLEACMNRLIVVFCCLTDNYEQQPANDIDEYQRPPNDIIDMS